MQRGRREDALPPRGQGFARSRREGGSVNEPEDELELQAMQRELEDAFATMRPRAGFEGELWQRMQAQRPAPNKIRDAFTGFWASVRAVPMAPAAATAAVLVVAVGVGLLTYTGALRGHGGAATSAQKYS